MIDLYEIRTYCIFLIKSMYITLLPKPLECMKMYIPTMIGTRTYLIYTTLTSWKINVTVLLKYPIDQLGDKSSKKWNFFECWYCYWAAAPIHSNVYKNFERLGLEIFWLDTHVLSKVKTKVCSQQGFYSNFETSFTVSTFSKTCDLLFFYV